MAVEATSVFFSSFFVLVVFNVYCLIYFLGSRCRSPAVLHHEKLTAFDIFYTWTMSGQQCVQVPPGNQMDAGQCYGISRAFIPVIRYEQKYWLTPSGKMGIEKQEIGTQVKTTWKLIVTEKRRSTNGKRFINNLQASHVTTGARLPSRWNWPELLQYWLRSYDTTTVCSDH